MKGSGIVGSKLVELHLKLNRLGVKNQYCEKQNPPEIIITNCWHIGHFYKIKLDEETSDFFEIRAVLDERGNSTTICVSDSDEVIDILIDEGMVQFQGYIHLLLMYNHCDSCFKPLNPKCDPVMFNAKNRRMYCWDCCKEGKQENEQKSERCMNNPSALILATVNKKLSTTDLDLVIIRLKEFAEKLELLTQEKDENLFKSNYFGGNELVQYMGKVDERIEEIEKILELIDDNLIDLVKMYD